MPTEHRSRRARVHRFWRRHRRLFWLLHSVWALTTGVVVVILARERYGFVPWVLAFLGITWLSTMFFGGRPAKLPESDEEPWEGIERPDLGDEITSYVTRTLYQETLFFLIPFYAYSTVVDSPNVAFIAMLGSLALLSCLDLLFDRWLRTSAVFGLVFFTAVAFAALNLILPMVTGTDPRIASPVAAVLSVASAVPLALRSADGLKDRVLVGATSVVVLVVAIGAPVLVPPVPLRLESATFASKIDRETLALSDTLPAGVPAASIDGALIVLVEVFAPAVVPAAITLEWSRDGEPFRASAEVEILAHRGGFRIWDGWRPEPPDRIEPGSYRVTLRTRGGRVFGFASLDVTGT